MEINIPQILIPRFVEMKDPALASLGVYGEYHIIKKRRGVIIQELRMKNIITDKGLQRLASSPSWLYHRVQYLHLGTGTAIPVTTDVSLQARGFTKTQNNGYSGSNGSGNDWYFQIQWDMGLDEAIGSWTEVGCGWESSSPYTVFSRSLFKDETGNPITIQKTGEDTLTIIYKIHVQRTSDTPFSNVVALSGVGDITVDSIMVNQGLIGLTAPGASFVSNPGGYYQILGTNGDPIDASVLTRGSYNLVRTNFNPMASASLVQLQSYVANSMYRDMVIEWSATVVGNIGEASINITDSYYYAGIFMRFNPVITKDNTKKFRIGFRVTFNRVA